ncbi:DDE-type integrase/transposase/recombinase [Nocardia sp. NPDC050193]
MVERVFNADRPNRLWAADATRIPCGQGAFLLAAVRDAFSNWIVGWKTSDRCDTELVLGALEFAVWSGDIRDGELIHHSDRGSTYIAIQFANRVADNGIANSMGSIGDSHDNASMEEFFSRMPTYPNPAPSCADGPRTRARDLLELEAPKLHPGRPRVRGNDCGTGSGPRSAAGQPARERHFLTSRDPRNGRFSFSCVVLGDESCSLTLLSTSLDLGIPKRCAALYNWPRTWAGHALLHRGEVAA